MEFAVTLIICMSVHVVRADYREGEGRVKRKEGDLSQVGRFPESFWGKEIDIRRESDLN